MPIDWMPAKQIMEFILVAYMRPRGWEANESLSADCANNNLAVQKNSIAWLRHQYYVHFVDFFLFSLTIGRHKLYCTGTKYGWNQYSRKLVIVLPSPTHAKSSLLVYHTRIPQYYKTLIVYEKNIACDLIYQFSWTKHIILILSSHLSNPCSIHHPR